MLNFGNQLRVNRLAINCENFDEESNGRNVPFRFKLELEQAAAQTVFVLSPICYFISILDAQ
jgi:hypothetical protein